jgi:4-hydroxy-tetrahydrodipicolinate reductase
MVRVCIAGAMGWTGKALTSAALDRSDIQLVSAVSRRHAGQNVGAALGRPAADLKFVGTIAEGLAANPDVLIDYTHPSAAFGHAMAAIERGVHVVLGTTGLEHNKIEALDRAAQKTGVGVVSGNFSVTAAMMAHLAAFAARHLDYFEIVDCARSQKPDSPSGTATELALELGQIKQPKLDVAIENTIGPQAARGANIGGVQVHAVRLPSFQLAIDVIFAKPGERLVIRHEAGDDPSVYVDGTFLTANRVSGHRGLVRGMNRILFASLEGEPASC